VPFISLPRLGRGEDIRFARRSVVIFAAGCGLIAFVGTAVLLLAYRAADAERWVNHTLEVRQAARELMNSALNAETGVRGFLLTDDPLFSEPYDAALNMLPAGSTSCGT
jgi:methyl-accepting chemotaxis protein